MDIVRPVQKNKIAARLTQEWSQFEILNKFAVELISFTDEVELAWYVAREVVAKLGFVDCVVYYLDAENQLLKQIAAIGEKNPKGYEIANLLEIPVGRGITGHVAKNHKAIIANDLRDNEDYIADIEEARSEICVPLMIKDQVIGVIDCEDPRILHFNNTHLEILSSVAALTSAKIEIIRKSKALRESERRNKVVFNSSLDGIISIDTNGNIVECNPSAEMMFGISTIDAIGKSLADTIIPPELREQHSAGLKRFVETGIRKVMDLRMETIAIRSDGERFPVELTVTPYELDGQQYLTGFLRDMSEKKKAEQAEKAGKAIERRFSAFIEHLPSAFLIKDLNGYYLHANTKWHQWFNPDGNDIEGKTAFDFYPVDHARAVDKQDRLTAARKTSFEVEITTPLANGSEITSLLQKFPILDENGEVVAIGGVNTDISNRKKMEEDLRNAVLKAEEASQSKSVFLATMSHELRTPLNAIIGFSDMLCAQYFGKLGDDRYVDYAKNIQMSGKHLSALIAEVLDISSIELGIKDIKVEPVSLLSILSECINSLKLNAQRGEIGLVLDAPKMLPKINADTRALKQIFLNLITNSLKFCNAGDSVNIVVSHEKDKLVIKVADTGAGIKKEYLPNLTEPFVKGHDDSLTTHEGVGLGLSIVKSLVDAHMGTLTIESEMGVGTTVTVTLPC